MLRFWVITALAVASIAATLSLGRWQLSRAAQKEALQERITQQSQRPVLTASVVGDGVAQDISKTSEVTNAKTTLSDELLDRTLVLQGTWLPQDTVYLDNRQMNGKQGFFVLTPLQIEGQNRVVMVQRGWVQRNFTDRESLPPLVTPAGLVQVTGRIARGPAHLLALTKEPTFAPMASQGNPVSRIRQNLSLAAFQAETKLPLWDHLLLQTDAQADGLQRNWAAPNLGIEKHYGYAFQWFCLSVLIALLYVWFQLVPRSRSSQQAS